MDNKNIAKKLVTILASLSAVPKKGYNAHQKYYYMREVDIVEALKEELIKNKVILLTSSKLVDLKEKEKSYLTTVETTHTFIDSESGESLFITSVGSGWDSTDKGSAKAITSAVKYAIMKTFMISDEGADVENDGESVQKPVETPRTSFKKQQPVLITTEGPPLGANTLVVEKDSKGKVTLSPAEPAIEVTPVTSKRSFGKRTQTNEPNFP